MAGMSTIIQFIINDVTYYNYVLQSESVRGKLELAILFRESYLRILNYIILTIICKHKYII